MAGQFSYPEPGGRQPAPGRLHTVQDFANAHFVERPQPDRDRPRETIAAWMRRHGVLPRGYRLTPGDIARTLEFRDLIRASIEANHDGRVSQRALRRLNGALGPATLRLAFDDRGVPALAPDAKGIDSAFAQLAVIVLEAHAAGTWQRLKICPADDCRWAFYDASKNRSGAWCSMSDCGNRAKARAFRQRHRC